MQVLSLIASFMALRQAILREESEKILKAAALTIRTKKILLRDGSDRPSRAYLLNMLCVAT
jgi:hypothetical protein